MENILQSDLNNSEINQLFNKIIYIFQFRDLISSKPNIIGLFSDLL